MNLHQFRFVQEAARRNLNLTETAKALHTSQPGVSKAIIELEEELGIRISQVEPWRSTQVDYPHAWVQLNFCKVWAWQGEMQMREGQTFAWQTLPVQVSPVLPGTVPVLQWLAEERSHLGPTHQG